jgi:hypothetical protein
MSDVPRHKGETMHSEQDIGLTLAYISSDNEFTGGFFNVSVAIPVDASMSRSTRGMSGDDEVDRAFAALLDRAVGGWNSAGDRIQRPTIPRADIEGEQRGRIIARWQSNKKGTVESEPRFRMQSFRGASDEKDCLISISVKAKRKFL